MALQCSRCHIGMRVDRTADPFEDVVTCPRCGYTFWESWSREFGPRAEEVQAMARKKREDVPVETEPEAPEAQTTEPVDEPEPTTAAVVAYPSCTKCGLILALDAEKDRGVCEACEPLPPVQGEDATTDALLYDKEVADLAANAAPTDVPLPFPTPAPDPFDFHAAFTDIGKKAREVEANEKVYLELKERASDAKKRWEASASLLTQTVTEYDRKAREYEAYAERQQQMHEAQVEKLQAEVDARAEAHEPDAQPEFDTLDITPEAVMDAARVDLPVSPDVSSEPR